RIGIEAVDLEDPDILGARRCLVHATVLAHLGIGGEREISHPMLLIIARPSVSSGFGWYRLDIVGQGVEVHRSIIEPRGTFGRNPAQGVLEPIFVVAARKIL